MPNNVSSGGEESGPVREKGQFTITAMALLVLIGLAIFAFFGLDRPPQDQFIAAGEEAEEAMDPDEESMPTEEMSEDDEELEHEEGSEEEGSSDDASDEADPDGNPPGPLALEDGGEEADVEQAQPVAETDDEDGTEEEVAEEVGEAAEAEEVEEVSEVDITDLPPLSELPERGAVFRPPTLFLEGPVPTQEIADQFFNAAAAVVGPDNIVNNYVVRPDAPLDIDGNVRVEQAVVFASGSAEIADDFLPTLELAVAVMGLNPQAQLVVQGHTDDVGDDAANLTLSQARADAVAAYIIGRGVDADRLEAVGFGETDPVADNTTAEGRFQNRRIEFEIIDLLTPPS